MVLERPNLNYFAGWQYLFDAEYRQNVQEEWRGMPAFLVGLQVLAGIASLIFPVVIVGLIGFVLLQKS